MAEMVKWIDLKDGATKGRLKIMVLDGEGGAVQRKYLVITGMSSTSERWKRAVAQLGFNESPSKKYLIRQVQPGDKVNAQMFSSVWPNAALVLMNAEDVRLDLNPARRKKEEEQPTQASTEAETRTAAVELGEVVRLGRNADNEVVFKSPLGRYIERRGGNVFEGAALLSPALFLRAQTTDEEKICADGFVQAMLSGEVQTAADFHSFVNAISDQVGGHSAERINTVWTAIESAVMRHLTQTYQTPQDAYGDSARLYEYLPPYQGSPRGAAALPIPLVVMAQRLLGDTSNKDVAYPDAYDGAGFAFLPDGTRIHAFTGSKNIATYDRNRNANNAVWGQQHDPALDAPVDAMFINKDPGGSPREDFAQSIRALKGLKPDGRAVIALAAGSTEGTGELSRESFDFYNYLSKNYELEAAMEVPAQLTNRVGTNRALRVVAIRNRRPREIRDFDSFQVMNSWDECKTYVDEAIVKVNLKEIESESIDVDRVILENEFQRPYIAFSKTADATTMVPKNLQAPLQAALSNIEFLEGEIDKYVERELQFGENTLGERFSPEQVDALAVGIHSIRAGRAPIIGDETGIGKGRTLSGLAVWANKQGKNVIFITDKANLFSDLARDLRHIEEWGRFNPLLMNAGSVLIDGETKEIIHEGTPAAEVKGMVENMVPLSAAGYNMIFTTYSQIASEDSPKAEWLLSQVEDALFITDEAHVAAGSDSNMSRVVVDLQTRAWGVAYSSATWAKSSENLHIYSRAFPPAINISTLTTTMRSGGEAFAEVFSSMLAKDGSFIRREHDLSKLEIVVESDSNHLQRNSDIADKVAEVLGAMTFVGGEINRLLMKSNRDTIATLRRARDVHSSVAGSIVAERKARRRRAQAEAVAATDNPAAAAAVPAPVRHAAPVELFKASFGAGTVLYQVMRQVLAVLNADNVADLAIKAVSENRKPVIVFESTGETFIKRIIDEMTVPAIEGERASVPTHIPAPTIRDMLMKVVSRMGVVQRRSVLDTQLFRQTTDEDGTLVEEDVDVDAVLNGTAGAEGAVELSLEDLPGLTDGQRNDYLEGMKMIVDLIQKMPPLPLNSIDVVRARLESAGIRTGELSGRKTRLDMPEEMSAESIDGNWDQNPAFKNWKVSYRSNSKKVVNETTYEFNNGDLDALLINRSAATGISLHASPRFADRRRRELIEMQIPENPTDRIQLYGRVNRYDQVVGPRISIATTGIYGEVRQLMMQNKKLAKLSANVRSSRDNAAEIKHIVDIINPVGEAVCRRFLLENAPIRQRLGITDQELENPAISAASKLTSRLVLLRISEQRMVYEEIYGAYDEEIIRLDLAGKNPLKSRELDIRASVVKSRLAIGVEMDGLGSAFDGPVYMRELAWKQNLQPLEWTDIKTKIKASREQLLHSELAVLPSLEPLRLPRTLAGAGDVEVEDLVATATDQEDDLVAKQLRMTLAEIAATINSTEPAAETSEIVAIVPDEEDLPSELPQRAAFCKSLESAYGAFGADVGHVSISALKQVPQLAPHSDDLKKITVGFRQSQEIYSSLDLHKSKNLLAQVLGDRARLALAGSEFVDVEAALRSIHKNSVREMWAKKLWIEQHFEQIQPGFLVGLAQGTEDFKRRPRANSTESLTQHMENLFRERAIVTALIPPPKGKEAQLSKWKVEVVVPGDEKVRQISLSKLLEDVSLMALMRNETVSELELTGGPHLYGSAFAQQTLSDTTNEFTIFRSKVENSPRGYCDRKGYVLEGNMYLASEWAQATGKGHGVIYSDATGVRHRAVMLTQSSLYGDRNLFDHLPIRLWVPSMINNFIERIWNQPQHNAEADVPPNFVGNGYLFKTDFSSAMADSSSAKADASQILVVPDKFVAVALDRKEMARVSRAMRSESNRLFSIKHPNFKSYTPEQKVAAKEADMVKVSTKTKRGAQSMVVIETPDFASAKVAIDLISRAVGLEIYLWPNSRAGVVAAEYVAKYFEDRREEARSIRDAARERRAQGSAAVEAADVAPESGEEENRSAQQLRAA